MKAIIFLLLGSVVTNVHAVEMNKLNKEKAVVHNHRFELSVGQIEEFLSSQYRMPVHLLAVSKRPFISTFSEVISFGRSDAYFRTIEFEAVTAEGQHVRASCDLDIGFPTKTDLSVDECLSEDGAFRDALAPLSDFAKMN